MGQLWDLIETYRDGQQWPPSYRAMAGKVGIVPTAFTHWRNPKSLPSPANLHALAVLIGVPYSRVLDAALMDAGYYERTPDGRDPAPNTSAGSAPVLAEHVTGMDDQDEPAESERDPSARRPRRPPSTQR